MALCLLYNYWKEHSGEYDPKKDVIPESEMNKMHPKTKNEFQFEQWLFEQYGMTSKEKTENTLMGNLNVLLEVSDVIDIVALPVGAIAVGAKLVGKKVIKEVGEKAVKREVAGEVTETTAKKEMADTAEDLSRKTVKKENTLEDISDIKRGSGTLKSTLDSIHNLDDLLTNPNKLSGVSCDELYDYLIRNGYDVRPLSKGSYKGIPFEKGGGFKVNWGGDRILQYHPESLSHHGGAYFKISSGETGTIRIDLDGNIIE